MYREKKSVVIFSTLGLLVTTAIWGSTFFLIKDAVTTIHPLSLVAYRFAIAAGIYALILIVKKQQFFTNFRYGLLLGINIFAVYFTQTLGLKYTSSTNAAFISGLFIIFVPLLGYLFLKLQPRKMQLIALLFALVGLYLLTGGITNANMGDGITLITAVFMSINILIIATIVKKKKDVLMLGFQQFFVASMLGFIAALLFNAPLIVPDTNSIWPILYLALFGNAIAQGLQLLSQKHLDAVTATIIFITEPLFGALFAWTLGNEPFIFAHAIGGIFIIIGILLAELRLKSQK